MFIIESSGMIHKSIPFVAILLLTITVQIQGQVKSIDEANAEIEKLKKQLVEANERARVAEAMVRKAQESATRARYIAQAKAMAVKSQELGSDPEQEALVAGFHSLAQKTDGTLWAWGNNGAGVLGSGTNMNSGIPVQVLIGN